MTQAEKRIWGPIITYKGSQMQKRTISNTSFSQIKVWIDPTGSWFTDTLNWPLYFFEESFLLVPASLPHTLTDFVEWSNKYALQVVQYKLNYEHMLSSCARIKLKLSLIVMKLHFWLTSGEENLPCAENARANSQDMKDITHPYMFVRIFLALIGAITA